jgi:ABC-type glycerol-3-phosphate transport system substrate-binding protein
VAAALALSTLAACGGGAAKPTTDTLDPSKVTGTVNWWGWAPGPSISSKYIAEFNKQYPNIKVNYKDIPYQDYAAALRTGVQSSSGPDLYNLQPGGIAAQYGRFAIDLTPVVDQLAGAGWKDKVSAAGITAFTQDGKLRGLSVGAGGAGTLLVNKTMLDQFGVKPPTTLAEWLSACATIAAHGKLCFVQGAKDEWINQDMFQAIANSISPGKFRSAVDGKTPWTDPDLVRALNIFKDMFSNGIMQPGAAGIAQYPDAMNKFHMQQTAMILQGSWEAQQYNRDTQLAAMKSAGVSSPTPFTALLVPFPDVAGAGNKSTIFADPDYGLAVSAKANNAQGAEVFAVWLATSTQGQQIIANQFAQAPALKGVTPATATIVDPAQQVPSLQQMIKGVQDSTESRQIAYPDLVSALGDALSAVATGQAPDKVAQTLQDASAKVQR